MRVCVLSCVDVCPSVSVYVHAVVYGSVSVYMGIVNWGEPDRLDVIHSQLPGYRLVGILACCCVWRRVR